MPPFIIKRLPVRFTYDNNYFNDRYQGIPIGGYTQIIKKMLDHPQIQVKTGIDYFSLDSGILDEFDKVVYTGMIDQYYQYCYGPLEYRSLSFETEILHCENYQGNAVVNYTDAQSPFTRIIEHKHFEFGTQPKTIITREFPADWHPGEEPYYPVNDEKNNQIFQKYKDRASLETKVVFGGRLGMYRYFDMHQVIEEALKLYAQECEW